MPRCELSDGMTEVPSVAQFITEDEISHTLMRSSGVEGGKNRIFAYFTEAHTDREKADFLKEEYGVGGRSHAVSDASSSYVGYTNTPELLKKYAEMVPPVDEQK